MLTFKQFQQLCKESTLNSIYLADYKNTLNIHPSTVQSFFDSYIDSLMNDFIKKYPNTSGLQRDEHYYALLDNFNVKEAYNYYKNALSCDALPRDYYDGCYSLSTYHGYLFYSYNNFYFESAYFYINTNNHLVIKNFRKNRIRLDSRGDEYLIKNGIKLYLRDILQNNNDAINKRF